MRSGVWWVGGRGDGSFERALRLLLSWMLHCFIKTTRNRTHTIRSSLVYMAAVRSSGVSKPPLQRISVYKKSLRPRTSLYPQRIKGSAGNTGFMSGWATKAYGSGTTLLPMRADRYRDLPLRRATRRFEPNHKNGDASVTAVRTETATSIHSNFILNDVMRRWSMTRPYGKLSNWRP